MRSIQAKHTAPELMVRRAARKLGLHFKLHDKNLAGKPDLVFPSGKIAVFIHGCFWHGHDGCSRAALPKSRTAFWRSKIEGNVSRDRKTHRLLKKEGWKVVVFWGCQLGRPAKFQNAIELLTKRVLPHANL